MSVEYLPFDWGVYESQRNPQVVAWLRKNHQRAVTPEEFVAAIQPLKAHARGNKRHYTPSNLRAQYHRLKERFGFFHEQGHASAPAA